MTKHLAIVLCVVFIASCSVQGRRYRPGIHLDWSGKAKKSVQPPAYPPSPTVPKEPEFHSVAATASARLQEKDVSLPVSVMPVVKPQPPPDSCDQVHFRDGKIVHARVKEIGPAHVKYKRCDFEDGPMYTADRNTVLKVVYANGREEAFETASAATQPASGRRSEERPQDRRMLGQAVFSFVLSLISLIVLLLTLNLVLAIALAGAAVVLGIGSLVKISRGAYDGTGFAVTGITLGAIFMVIFIAILSVV